MKLFEKLLSSSAEAHGHLCPGQVVGVRMAMLGCRLIGLDNPTSHDQIKKLIIYVEMDRCAGDAVAHITGARLGRRSLKFADYGIMASTPGSMFLVAYLGKTTLLGVPACGLYHRITVLDLLLPRILAGEKIGKAELASLGHGGLCKDCPECTYPHCHFGKGA